IYTGTTQVRKYWIIIGIIIITTIIIVIIVIVIIVIIFIIVIIITTIIIIIILILLLIIIITIIIIVIFPLLLLIIIKSLTADFAGKRENYTELLRLLTEETGSKWRIVDEKPKTSGKLMKVSSFAEIPVLIRHMRVTKCRKHVNDENLQKVTSHLAYYLISLPLEDTLEEYEPGQSVVLLLI
ncbi:hypothetical protein AK812_SmicGene46187, partial [Symbiodinium microadriaticum]